MKLLTRIEQAHEPILVRYGKNMGILTRLRHYRTYQQKNSNANIKTQISREQILKNNTLQNETANGGVSYPSCSTATAPISQQPSTRSGEYGLFLAEKPEENELSSSDIAIRTTRIHIHIYIPIQLHMEENHLESH